MTCDCPRTGMLVYCQIRVHKRFYRMFKLLLESENLHADVREGRLSTSSDDKRFDSDREEKNPPSTG